MKRLLWGGIMFTAFILYTLHFTHYTVLAQTTPSTELITWAKHYDGKTVQFEGEVIGEIMIRGQYAWINLNDGLNAIGVWVDRTLLNAQLIAGSYKSKGAWIEVRGIFSRTCLQHSGDLDIHAQSLTVKQDGYVIPEKAELQKGSFALGALLVLGVIWLLTFVGAKPAGKKR